MSPSMETYQHDFIEFIIQENALQFGEFTLKSGRQSPYFFNIGHLCSGQALIKLGQFYALALNNSQVTYDVLFGPAYKGIPLAVATSMQLAEQYQKNIPYSFDRKEAKRHGEGGMVVGAQLAQKQAMIIDDVITAGTQKRLAIEFIKENGGNVSGVVIALDRQEKAENSDMSSVQQLEKTCHIPVISIANLDNVITYLKQYPNEHKQHLETLTAYQQKYGIA